MEQRLTSKTEKILCFVKGCVHSGQEQLSLNHTLELIVPSEKIQDPVKLVIDVWKTFSSVTHKLCGLFWTLPPQSKVICITAFEFVTVGRWWRNRLWIVERVENLKFLEKVEAEKSGNIVLVSRVLYTFQDRSNRGVNNVCFQVDKEITYLLLAQITLKMRE
jgi:hypothetical protein